MVKIGKVIVCGMKGIGKTAVIEQLVYGNVTKETEIFPTIEDVYVASVDTGRAPRDILRIFDTGGLMGNGQLPKHYFQFADAFVLMYDPLDHASLDMLAGIKNDIERNKDKKEIIIIVVANMRFKSLRPNLQQSGSGDGYPSAPQSPTQEAIDVILNRANNWCTRERMKHYVVNAMERASIYGPFIDLATRLHPQQTKTTFPQLRQLTQKTQKTSDS